MTPTASMELTLRGFLQAVFPFAKKKPGFDCLLGYLGCRVFWGLLVSGVGLRLMEGLGLPIALVEIFRWAPNPTDPSCHVRLAFSSRP